MWRREDRLEYWLTGGNLPDRQNPALRLKEALAYRFAQWRSAHAVREQSLRIDTGTVCLDEELSVAATVNDGMKILGRGTDNPPEPAGPLDGFLVAVHCIDLLDGAAVRSLKLPDEYSTRIHESKPAIKANSRRLQLSIETRGTHALSCLQDRPAQIKNGDRFLGMNPAIETQVSRISGLPHMRIGLDVERLRDSERRSFLREAEILKRIPSDRAELLAVFRHVPIEMISRLRLLAEKRVILYCISEQPKRTCTRVHDMAAVRDAASGEIHLVPHRTQFRAVSFN
jgi:hypothetical protein